VATADLYPRIAVGASAGANAAAKFALAQFDAVVLTALRDAESAFSTYSRDRNAITTSLQRRLVHRSLNNSRNASMSAAVGSSLRPQPGDDELALQRLEFSAR